MRDDEFEPRTDEDCRPKGSADEHHVVDAHVEIDALNPVPESLVRPAAGPAPSLKPSIVRELAQQV